MISFKIQGKTRPCNVWLYPTSNLELKNLNIDLFDVIICDGPYGLVPPYDAEVAGYDCEWDNFVLISKKGALEFRDYYRTLFNILIPYMNNTSSLFVFGFPEGMNIVKDLLDTEYDLNFRRSISWAYKNHYDFDRGLNFHRSHETILYYTKTKDFIFKSGGVRDVINLPVALRETNVIPDGAKPLNIVEFLLDASYKPGGRLLSLFGGSGTDLVAAAEYDMDAVGFEFNPSNVKVIIDRLQNIGGSYDSIS
jgi:DNA modification methylase